MQSLLVDTFASYRITRLIVTDKFPPTMALRKAILDRFPEEEGGVEPWPAQLIQCPWCMGFWVALGVVLARRFVPGWKYLGKAFAMSAVSGLIAEKE
jgi:hypothetical protein